MTPRPWCGPCSVSRRRLTRSTRCSGSMPHCPAPSSKQHQVRHQGHLYCHLSRSCLELGVLCAAHCRASRVQHRQRHPTRNHRSASLSLVLLGSLASILVRVMRGDGRCVVACAIALTVAFVRMPALRAHKRGDRVVGLDSFSAYYAVPLKRSRVSILARHGVRWARSLASDLQQGCCLTSAA